jgi:hypothetical protein
LILKARKRSEMNLKLKIPEIIGREDQVQRWSHMKLEWSMI